MKQRPRGRSRRRHTLLLTITGDSERHFRAEENDVLAAVEEVAGRYTLQRFDLESGRGQVRVVLGRRSAQETVKLVSTLRQKLPDCELSYVNVNSGL